MPACEFETSLVYIVSSSLQSEALPKKKLYKCLPLYIHGDNSTQSLSRVGIKIGWVLC